MKSLRLKAYAKINLGLDVSGKRPDGYHLLSSVMQTVNLFDELELTKEEEGIRLITDMEAAPPMEENLAFRAARLMFETFSLSGGLSIRLKKNIPQAAGLGGGSADAAAVLRGVNRLFELGETNESLESLGLGLGADVPFLIRGGTCLAEGVGEILTPLVSPEGFRVLLAKPSVQVSTREVFEGLCWETISSGERPDMESLMALLKAGNRRAFASGLKNVLERVTLVRYPVVADLKAAMVSCKAAGSLMSGSGPTVFGLFEEEENARECMNRLSGDFGSRLQMVYLTDIRKEYI